MSLLYQAVQILYWFVLSVWLGGMVFLAAGAPVVFRAVRRLDARAGTYGDPALDEQQTTIVAGEVVGSLLNRMVQIEVICAGAMLPLIVAQFLLIDLTETNRTAAIVRALLWAGAAVIAAYQWRVQYPHAWQLREQYLQSTDDPEAADRTREAFDREHRKSEQLFMVTVFLLIGLVLLSANITPRPRGGGGAVPELPPGVERTK